MVGKARSHQTSCIPRPNPGTKPLGEQQCATLFLRWRCCSAPCFPRAPRSASISGFPGSTSASTCLSILTSSGSPAIPSITIRTLIRTTSFTTACTGPTRGTTGIRAPGTTGRGNWSSRSMCRSSCCLSRCATTAPLRCTFAAGQGTARHAGVSTGAEAGNSGVPDGTGGIAGRLQPPRPCLFTSGNIPATAILARSRSSRRSGHRITATSRATL